jgi:hypothetical protein
MSLLNSQSQDAEGPCPSVPNSRQALSGKSDSAEAAAPQTPLEMALEKYSQAQSDWPHSLLHEGMPATLEDCERWWREVRTWLAPDRSPQPTPAERAMLETFGQRVVIYRGDLKADPLAPCFGGCG